MLTPSQITKLYDYVILFRYQAEKLTREAANSRNLDPELQAAIVHEQTRRKKELKRLERALGAEIEAFTEGSEIVCHESITTTKPHATAREAKRKNNANVSSEKRKPGRPRETAQKE